jgi:WD40 repeat protein
MRQYKIYFICFTVLVFGLFNTSIKANNASYPSIITFPFESRTVSWSPIENIIAIAEHRASVPEDGYTIKIYRVDMIQGSFEELKTIIFSDAVQTRPPIEKLSWSPDGTKLVSISRNYYRVYETIDFSLLYELHNETGTFITWSPDSAYFIMPRGEVRYFETDTGHEAVTLEVVNFNIVDANTGAVVDKIEVNNPSELTIYEPSFWVTDMTWSTSPPNRVVFRGRYDLGFMVNLDDDPHMITPFLQCCGEELLRVQWQPDGDYLATQQFIYDVLSDDILFYYPAYYSDIQWDTAGQLLATTFLNTVSIISIAEQAIVVEFEVNNTVFDMAWSPDSRYLLTAIADEVATIWDIQAMMEEVQ